MPNKHGREASSFFSGGGGGGARKICLLGFSFFFFYLFSIKQLRGWGGGNKKEGKNLYVIVAFIFLFESFEWKVEQQDSEQSL